jgi:hypothetical protein
MYKMNSLPTNKRWKRETNEKPATNDRFRNNNRRDGGRRGGRDGGRRGGRGGYQRDGRRRGGAFRGRAPPPPPPKAPDITSTEVFPSLCPPSTKESCLDFRHVMGGNFAMKELPPVKNEPSPAPPPEEIDDASSVDEYDDKCSLSDLDEYDSEGEVDRKPTMVSMNKKLKVKAPPLRGRAVPPPLS